MLMAGRRWPEIFPPDGRWAARAELAREGQITARSWLLATNRLEL